MSNLMLEIRPNPSCDYHRVVLPFKYANIQPKVPVYVFNRIPSASRSNLQQLKKLGVKIICDVDDYWHLDPAHYLADSFRRSGMTQRIIDAISVADVVTVTTPYLASRVREYNRRVVVIPNALPFDSDQFCRSPEKTSGRYFVWAGGASHRHDLKILSGLYADITIAGYNPHDSEWVRVKEGSPGAEVIEEKPNTQYMSVYDTHRVALAPLIDSMFNGCKSNLKILEAGAKGIPIITSSVSPYLNHVDKGMVFYAASRAEWVEQMRRLKDNPNLAEDAGERLAEHVRLNYHLNDANEIRRQVIESFS
ncbi:glycosyltransferase [Serratia sp. M24T3]|uniref:glycosyltransferase family protein n=1 Tax=Serratia sp. M24T3 TaxID=932213 RepID=UPI00025BA807|nr:glycosyltransferase [Serratia sp. M24T3]EIC82163.1 hypothetical protein SPM24T3_23307 [Serratia sp. M24T3]